MKNKKKKKEETSVRKDQIDAYLKEIEYTQRAALRKKISYVFIGVAVAGGIAIFALTQITMGNPDFFKQFTAPSTLNKPEVVSTSSVEPQVEIIPVEQDSATSDDPFFNGQQEASDDAVIISDRMPSFPGGEPALYRFISREVRYPTTARSNQVEGKVHLRFVVEADGKITNVKVVRGLGFGCDEEALRILNKMPIWEPGILNGKAVPVYSSLAVEFRMI